MTLSECKDKVAISHGFQNWRHMGQNSTLTERDSVNAIVAELYAQSLVESKDKRIAELEAKCNGNNIQITALIISNRKSKTEIQRLNNIVYQRYLSDLEAYNLLKNKK